MNLSEPDAWTTEAAAQSLAFAQVREDPRLDLRLTSRLPAGARVVMVASGGDTAACLIRQPLGELHLVDMNPSQLALTRLKLHLAQTTAADHAAAILGHLPLPEEERLALILRGLEKLKLPPESLGPLPLIARLGPDHAGRYELTFAALRRELQPWREALDSLLQSGEPSEAAILASPAQPLGRALDDAFAKVMSLPNLVRLFGPGATQNPRCPFHEHFATRLRVTLSRTPARANPFLWQILAGKFPPGHRYDWLQPGRKPPPPSPPLITHCGQMAEYLRGLPPGSVDLVHLSNILDWLSVSGAEATLGSASRALKPGGRLIIRQLNSTLEVDRLASGIRWDPDLSDALEKADRSFFYPRIHTGEKP